MRSALKPGTEFPSTARQVVLLVSIVVVLAALAFWTWGNITRQGRATEEPYGCDWFGFLRQAQLFREHGFVGGLDTAIRDENSRYVVEKIRTLYPDKPGYAGSATPYRHWYHARTDRISIVSPPGTGLIISLFPEGVQARFAVIFCVTAAFGILAWMVSTARTWTVSLVAGLLGVMVIRGMRMFANDWSIPPTIPLMMIAAYCTVRLFESACRGSGASWAAMLGLVIGAAMTIRIPNVLIAFGIAVALGGLFLQGRRLAALKLSLIFAGGATVGFLPTFAANAINAGHPLTTAYGVGNTAAFRFDWEAVRSSIDFYLISHQTFFALAGLATAGLVIVVVLRRALDLKSTLPIVAGATSLLITFGFTAVYLNHILYLPFPAIVYAGALSAFLLTMSENRRALRWGGSLGGMSAALLATIAVGGVLVFAFVTASGLAVSPNYGKPDVNFSLPARSVVWASTSGGQFYIYLDRQAMVLSAYPIAAQDRIIAAVAADRMPQFVVADHYNMELLERLKSTADLKLVGTAFANDVYQIMAPTRAGLAAR